MFLTERHGYCPACDSEQRLLAGLSTFGDHWTECVQCGWYRVSYTETAA